MLPKIQIIMVCLIVAGTAGCSQRSTILSANGVIDPAKLAAIGNDCVHMVVNNDPGLKAFLAARDIGTLIHYPIPIHLQPAYHGRVLVGVGGLGHTEQSCREVLSLPMHPQMSNEHVLRVAGLIVAWDRGGGHGDER